MVAYGKKGMDDCSLEKGVDGCLLEKGVGGCSWEKRGVWLLTGKRGLKKQITNRMV